MIYDMWKVKVTGKAKKAKKILSKKAYDAFLVLLQELENGPTAPSWPNYSKLDKITYHCHLGGGRPVYVTCWRGNKKIKVIEVYYAGTHENAPY